ncbi:MAG: hypothetical protein AAF202_13855, partial [Pseudomonadota bacterium]
RLAEVAREDIAKDRLLFEEAIANQPDSKVLQYYYESLVLFVDRMLKDRKIGTPSGAHLKSCPFVSCPFTGEHRRSELGVEALIWNYEGLLQIFTASTNPQRRETTNGFFGLMHAKKFGPLGNQIFDLLSQGKDFLNIQKDQTIQELASLQTTKLCQPEAGELKPLCEAHGVAKSLSDIFKVDLKVALTFENTKPVEGDGD